VGRHRAAVATGWPDTFSSKAGSLRTMVILYLAALCLAQSTKFQGDHLGFLDNGTIRVGVNLNLGGAITYLSKSGSDVNVVNSADWGRQIQMSHYSGPVPFAPSGNKPAKAWEGLGWNPIQSGDAFGNRSKVLAYRNDGKSIYVKCTPMQWPLNNVPGECTFECWLRLDGQAVQVRSRLVNARSDHTQFEGRGQELPAVYTNGPWYRLMTYTGDKPFTNDVLSQRPSVFMWTGLQATENWAALLDDSGFGLGVWHPGVYSFIGGFFGQAGAGGPHDSATGYIAPVFNEVIDWNIVYDYKYTLILGKLDEIRSYVYRHAKRPSPPDYNFARDRQHWIYHGAVDQGWPIHRGLRVSLTAPTAQLVGPDGLWLAADTTKLVTEAAFSGLKSQPILYWKRADDPAFTESKSQRITAVTDGKVHRLEIDLSQNPEYRGTITGIRIGLVKDSELLASCDIRRISIRKN